MQELRIKDFLDQAENHCIIDVRSPDEYHKGHITEAVNIPLLNDEERKIVGTKYKQESRDTAYAAAFEYIAFHAHEYLEKLSDISQSKKIFLYCWRGGFRSGGMGHLFEAAGYNVTRLAGGYKAYRNHVLARFEKKYDLVILGGMTGSGKSELLAEIKIRGEQIIDLEGLANHKGSAFGALGEGDQPSVQQFENDLFSQIDKLDLDKRIWLEDESRLIGKVKIPDAFFKQMREANVIKVEVPKKVRIKRLIADYAKFTHQDLINSIERISKRLGGEFTQKAIAAVKKQDYSTAADIILNYYDKTYNYGLNKRDKNKMFPVQVKWQNFDEDIDKILAAAKEL